MSPSAWRKLPPGLVAAALFTALAFWLSWPTWVEPGALIGGGLQPDWTGTMWAWWWTGHALTSGLSPFVGTFDYFPVGQDPVAQYNLVDAVLAAPLLGLFGPTWGYDLACVAILVSTGLGARALCRSLDLGEGPALVGGAALMASPFLLYELSQGRPSQALLVFWLLALRGSVRGARGQAGLRESLLTGLFAGLSALTYWYYGLFLALAALPAWLGALPRLDRRRLISLGASVAAAVVLTAPFVWSLAGSYGGLPGVDRPLEAWMQYGSKGKGEFALSMAIRNSHHWTWPLWTTVGENFDKRLPLGLLALAGLGLWRPRRSLWVGVVALGYVLSLGPWLKDPQGQPLGPPLPYLWLYEHLPFFDRLWWPDRFELIVVVGLVVLAARGVALLAELTPRAWVAPVIAVGLLVADQPWRQVWLPVFSEAPRPVDTAFYEGLEGPMLTTPLMGLSEAARHSLWAQVHHHQPISGGLGDHLPGHRPPAYDAWVEERALLVALRDLSQGPLEEQVVQPEHVQAVLDDGFTWFVVDPVAYSPSYEEGWVAAFSTFAEALWGEPDRVSGQAAAWRMEPLREARVLPAVAAVEPPAPVLPAFRRQAEKARDGGAQKKAILEGKRSPRRGKLRNEAPEEP